MPGRKRKNGKREKNGRISRAGLPRYDSGTDRAREKLSVYGTDGSDAIGRAFRAGLLGEDGAILVDTARAVHRAYWPMLGVGRIGCTLGNRTGQSGDGNPERERWLKETLDKVNVMGRPVRRAFDDLVININPDEGPVWLDRLIASKPHSDDGVMLAMAIRGISALAA